MDDYAIYEETTSWAPWVGWLLVGILFVVFWATLQANPQHVGIASLSALPVVAFSVAFLGRLRVRVLREALLIGFGYVDLIRRRVPYDDIQSIEPVKYSPLTEFGGWGIKWGRGGKVAWTIRGNQALVLHLKNGKHLYVGSETPARLAERVYQAAGDKLSASQRRAG